jgi:hypothetical protein
MTHTLAIVAFGLCVFAGTLHAKRTCRLVYPERPQDAPKVAFLFDGAKSHSITLPSMNLSEVIELPAGEITLAMTTTEITNPELLPAQAPLLKIPEAVSDFYIIVIPDPENTELPVKMNLVDTGGGKLKPGETLWYNLTEHRIVAKLGESDMSVAPKGKMITKDPISSSGYYAARFAYQANGKGAVAPITEQSWWHDANSKHLGFVVNTGGKLPKIYFFRDFRMKEEEQAPPEE